MIRLKQVQTIVRIVFSVNLTWDVSNLETNLRNKFIIANTPGFIDPGLHFGCMGGSPGELSEELVM